MKQKVIFTALPNGINARSGNLKLSVAISLQVIETAVNTKLSSVPDMQSWADLINKAKFVVQLNGTAVDAIKTTSDADIELWKNLFTPSVNVNAFVQEDKTKVPILSYPVKHIVSYIKSTVEQTGKAFVNDMPDASYYTSNPLFTSISNYSVIPFQQTERQRPTLEQLAPSTFHKEKVKRLFIVNPVIPFSPAPNPEMDFAQLCNFHGLYDAKPKAKFIQFPKPDFEFHDIVSVLTQYPKLMRRLGLVVDFEIPNKASILSPGTVAALRVFPTGLNFSTLTTITCPGTAYELTANGFYSKAQAGSFHEKGHVKINSDAFTVFQVDTDGAALKLTSHIDALQLKKAKHIFYALKGMLPDATGIPVYNNEETPRREGLPSHRTAGIGLAKNGMATYLNARFARMNVLQTAFATAAPPPAGVSSTNATYVVGSEILFSDDVNIGYRLDVKMTDKAGDADTWHSLHFHENTYSFLNSANTSVTINDIGLDEGFIQLSTSEDKNIDGPHMKLSEVIARWEGWSLAVPKPGLSLNEPTLDKTKEIEENDADEADKYKTPNDVPFKLNVVPVVSKGTLPRLRFGQTYAIKLRMVDMAGNSVPHNSNPENIADAMVNNIRYLRYEPVDAPFLVPGNIFVDSSLSDPDHNNFRDGESSEVMVIRSNEGQTVQQYENDPAHIYNAQADIKGQPGPFRDVCTRHVKPPRTTVGMAITHSMLEQAIGVGSLGIDAVYNKITNDKDPVVKSDPKTDDIKFDSSAVAQVASSEAVSTPVEYLVDPMAAGVSFFMSALDPNVKAPADLEKYAKRVSFYFDDEVKTDTDSNRDFDYNMWMEPKTFRIILKEGDVFSFDWSNNAERKLTVSMPKGFLLKLNYACFWKPKDVIRLSGALNMMGLTTLTDVVGQNIALGRHWLFSPWRTLTFVHAVQQPVTTIFITPKTLPFINNATSVRSFGDTFAGLNLDVEVHGASTGVADLEATWADLIDDVNDLTHNEAQVVPKKAKVYHWSTLYHVYHYVFGDFPDKGINANPFKAVPHQFNDTRHRWVDYQLIASTRYKEYFYNAIREKGEGFKITRESNVVQRVNVLSSARPAAPQIAYVIPTFEWGKEIKGDTIINGRGSGLRVYLKRPWYTSGEGEKLAVTLISVNATQLFRLDTSAFEKICTTWGNDPSKRTPTAGGIFPIKEVFVGVKTGTPENLYAEEHLSGSEEGATVNVVAYDVQYDQERQLYYADIMINFGVAYFPFVRLALAAYQQHSVRKDGKDVCLSKIVQADYIQIPPPRFSSLKRNGTNITVAISGTLPDITNRENYMPKVEFTIEQLEFQKSEDVVITINAQPILTYSKILTVADVQNFIFNHSHDFSLPPEYATKPYRVKIFEYEMIIADSHTSKPGPVVSNFQMKDRMVFADVYEVNM
jgi:hypothetical protein